MVIEAVVGELVFFSCHQVLDEQVVVAHKSDFGCIRREGGQTLLAVLRKGLQGLGFEVINIIHGVERVAVDALHLRGAQHLVLVCAQCVILKPDGQRIRMQGQVGYAEQRIFQLSRLVVVDVELAFLEVGVSLAVLHRIHAAHALRIECRAHVKVFQIEIFLLLGRSRKRSKNKEQTD